MANTAETLKHEQSTPFPEKFYDDPTGLDRYVVQEKVLFSWQGPSKIEKKKRKNETAQLILFAVILILILFLLQEILLGVVVIVFAFLYIVFEASPPMLLSYQITTIGLKVEDKYYYWQQLSQFWFEERNETRVLHLRNLYPHLQIMKLIIHPDDEAEIKNTLGKYLLYKKPQQTTWEKWLKRVGSYLPLDIDPF
jgi:hypothetical protein